MESPTDSGDAPCGSFLLLWWDLVPGRVVVRVRGRELGADGLPPRLQFGVQLRRAVRLLRGQVGRLPDVVLQVVQLDLAGLEELDQLPVPDPGRRVRRRP